MKMDVAICYGPQDVRIEQRACEPLAAGEVRVKVRYCGVCPWDLRAYSGGSSSIRYPLQFGHEISGVIAEIAPDVVGPQVGQAVVVDAVRRCGVCPACRRGLFNHCQRPDYSRGGFAHYIDAPAANVHTLRAGTSLLAASLTEPLACIVRAQNRAAARPGEVALLVGCGPLGLLHLQLLKLAGARVIACDPLPARLAAAERFGADCTVNPRETSLAQVVADFTGGWGAEVVIMAASPAAALEQALPLLSVEGRIVLFAGVFPKTPISLDPNAVHYAESWITGSSEYGPAEFAQALALIEDGRVQVEPLISDIFPLQRLDDALQALKSSERLKLVIQCDAEEAPQNN
jgi:L-iditol 2-dehydrogenase